MEILAIDLALRIAAAHADSPNRELPCPGASRVADAADALAFDTEGGLFGLHSMK